MLQVPFLLVGVGGWGTGLQLDGAPPPLPLWGTGVASKRERCREG